MTQSQRETLQRLLSGPPVLIVLLLAVWRGGCRAACRLVQATDRVPGSAVWAPVLFAMSAALIAGPADAQAPRCVPRDTAVEQLTQHHGEQVTARGLTSSGQVMFELFATDSGSWTLVTTDARGRSCVVASGDSWMAVPRIKGDPV